MDDYEAQDQRIAELLEQFRKDYEIDYAERVAAFAEKDKGKDKEVEEGKGKGKDTDMAESSKGK
eukprot:13256200-Alexandrium_andersonii.AAC.1